MRQPFRPASPSRSQPTGGGLYTQPSHGGGSVNLTIAHGSSSNINVRITEPAWPDCADMAIASVIRATFRELRPRPRTAQSDRLYTGFVRLDKTFSVSNGTGVGGATDPVPARSSPMTSPTPTSLTSNRRCELRQADGRQRGHHSKTSSPRRQTTGGTSTANSGSPADSGLRHGGHGERDRNTRHDCFPRRRRVRCISTFMRSINQAPSVARTSSLRTFSSDFSLWH